MKQGKSHDLRHIDIFTMKQKSEDYNMSNNGKLIFEHLENIIAEQARPALGEV